MTKQRKPMKISTRLTITVIAVFAVAAIIIIALVNYYMKQQALTEAESKARIILDRNLATHTYFTRDLKPKLFELTEPIQADDYFEPTWMSSTYAVRQLHKYFKSFSPANYYYKEIAVNARSPENDADAYERMFLDELNRNPKLVARSDVRIIDGKPYLVVLHRGEMMEESCLRCHGNPNDAPRDLVRHYGPERGFHRKIGDAVHAISIRVPLSVAYSAANRFSLRLSGLLLMVLGCLFVVQFWFSKRLLFSPLAMVHKKALQISTNIEHLGEVIPVHFGRELNEMAAAFNAMSISLRRNRDHLEERVKERTDALERSNKELQQFAYVVSHDLQEPLRMVSGYVQLLARRYNGKLDADAEEFISYAVDGAKRMQQLINDLLAYSRVGTRDKDFELTDCEVVFGHILANLQVAIEESGAVVTHDPLPTIMADVSQITQLFQNLIGNAIKFHGEELPRVHVSVEKKENEWLFSVRDNGIGIDPEYFDRIFVIFQQLHSRTEYPGAGIGLAISKKIVERHGGRIWVDSQPGKGSTFYFTIPVIED
jgi:signal transduction histidine kinase